MARAPVAVALVTFDSARHLPACLASLAPALAGRPARLVVVDNASADGTRELVRALAPHALLIANPVNRGYGAALNQALAVVDEQIAVLANPDVAFGEGSLDRLAAFLEASPRHALAGPRGAARAFPTVALEACELFLGHRLWPQNPLHRRFFRQDLSGAAPADADWLVGACLAARSGALARVGGFDERYPLYFEEVDLAWRLGRAGYACASVPDAVVEHAGGGSSAAHALELERVYLASQRRFFARAHGAPAAATLSAVQIAGQAFRLAWWGVRSLLAPEASRHLAPARARARRALNHMINSRNDEAGRLARGVLPPGL